MIRPLRRRHRVMMIALAMVVPALFVAGLWSRPTSPVMPQLILEAPDSRVEVAAWSEERWHGARVRWGRVTGHRNAWILEPLQELHEPLVYVVDGPAPGLAPGPGLPESAVLLGRLAGPRARLQLVDDTTGATLILYDPEHGQVIAWAELTPGGAS